MPRVCVSAARLAANEFFRTRGSTALAASLEGALMSDDDRRLAQSVVSALKDLSQNHSYYA
jgi:hypothetical protein